MTWLFDRLKVLLGISASACSIIVSYNALHAQESQDARFAIGVMGAFVAVLWVYILWQEFHLARKARYAESLDHIQEIYTRLAELCQKPNELDTHCRGICDSLARAFSIITATDCAACLKVLSQPPDQATGNASRLSVSTLCRDSSSDDSVLDRNSVAWTGRAGQCLKIK